MNRVLMVGGFVTVFVAAVGSAQHPLMPPGMTHEEHLAQIQKEAEMKKRGAVAMAFDQDRTTHHFELTASGGFIQVQVKDPTDATNRAAIRAHLKTIAGEFASGDFNKPLMTHDETPPGVQTLQRLKSAFTFRFEETEDGGRVRITAHGDRALKAVHDFLRYQIHEHATGDSPTVHK